MAIPATQLRPGMIIKHNNDLHSVFSVEHRTPGNLRAFIQAKLRNLRTGAMFEHRFRSPDPIDKVNVDEVQMEFLYQDGGDYHFMNTENYEQITIPRALIEDVAGFLTPNLEVQVEFYETTPLNVTPPKTVDLKVVRTDPGMRNAAVTNTLKPATMETGLVVQVPHFVNEGDIITINTETHDYAGRAK
jgi:elongation factor P